MYYMLVSQLVLGFRLDASRQHAVFLLLSLCSSSHLTFQPTIKNHVSVTAKSATAIFCPLRLEVQPPVAGVLLSQGHHGLTTRSGHTTWEHS